MKRLLSMSIVLIFAVISFAAIASIPSGGPFNVSWDARKISLSQGESFYLKVKIDVPSGHYLYAEDTELDFVSLDGLIIKDIDYPMPAKRKDPYVSKIVEAYDSDITIGIAGMVPDDFEPGKRDLVANVRFKGCSDKICFRPEEREISFLIDVVGGSPILKPHELIPLDKSGEADEVSIKNLLKAADFSALLEKGFFLTIFIVFIAGILTSLTPCVWPVIPAVLIFVGVHPHKKFWENLLLSSFLTAGLVLVYSMLGIIAVAFGKNVGFLFQNRIFLIAVVIFFIAMSLSMFGLFDIRLPGRWHQRMQKMGGEGYLGAFIAGLGLGLVASPCAGPVIASLLGYVALQRNYLFGFMLLVVFSIGMGLLFIILGACYGELAGKFKGGRWLIYVRRFLGLLLLVPAVFYAMSAFDFKKEDLSGSPRVEWMTVKKDAFNFASKSSRPLMIEFTADWCPPCKALDRRFFKRLDIIKLSYQLVPFKVDATIEAKAVRELMEKYNVMGMPAFIFLSPDGMVYQDLSVTDYDTKKIEASMKESIRRAKGK